MQRLSFISLVIISLIFHNLRCRNPFAFGQKRPRSQLVAYGKLHDQDLEFKVYTDKKNNVRLKTVENKSPST
jgi:hypothetical protein